MMDQLAKVTRLRLGGKPRVLDLFAGAGGFSLGFQRAGAEIVGAVEIDPLAAMTHRLNFNLDGVARDINDTPPSTFADVDIIIGGPPCQAFARVGRAKLRELNGQGAHLDDPRVNLYRPFLDYVRVLRPLAVVMENVPDLLNFGGYNLMEEVAQELTAMKYRVRYTLLNAVHYGVPQMRDRVFLLAYAPIMYRTPEFPAPTHHHDLPKGYHTVRRTALRHINDSQGQMSLFDPSTYFTPPPLDEVDLPPAVTVSEALADLPRLDAPAMILRGELKRGPRNLAQVMAYEGPPASDYARLMRQDWPGFASNGSATAHVIRYLPRDHRIFARMKPGDQYPEALALARQLLAQELCRRRAGGLARDRLASLKKKFIPPADPTKFANRWRKMEGDEPARTLMAHLSREGYTHIHYDDAQARTISVREAARLQSFPDGFVFAGHMNDAFRQIGEAVPPLLSYHLAQVVVPVLHQVTRL